MEAFSRSIRGSRHGSTWLQPCSLGTCHEPLLAALAGLLCVSAFVTS